jgi:hypothetical protein
MSTRPVSGWTQFLIIVAAVLAFVIFEFRMPRHSSGSDSVVRAGAVDPNGGKIAGCQIFPLDNVWNTPVNALPRDAKSDLYIASMGPQRKLHPDFGSDLNSGIPLTILTPNTTGTKVSFDYKDDSDAGMYPIPSNVTIEGGSDSTGDRHILLLDPAKCMLYELYDVHPQPDGSWKAGSGIRMDLASNTLRRDGKTSADAAGLPILPGLIRYDEVASGAIHHAIRFTVPKTRAAHIWPATHDASKITDPSFPPMGVRLRLRGDFDLSGYSLTNRVILTAMKRYGLILADNGSPFFLSGVPDKRWDDDDLHHLSGIKGEDFEVVDESMLQAAPASARVVVPPGR